MLDEAEERRARTRALKLSANSSTLIFSVLYFQRLTYQSCALLCKCEASRNAWRPSSMASICRVMGRRAFARAKAAADQAVICISDALTPSEYQLFLQLLRKILTPTLR